MSCLRLKESAVKFLPSWCHGYIQDGVVGVPLHEALDVENVTGEDQATASSTPSEG